MKKLTAFFLSFVLMFSFFAFDSGAVSDNEFVPYVIDFNLTTDVDFTDVEETESRASGLITYRSLSLSKSGTTLKIKCITHGTVEVVKSGFKNLVIERKKSSSSSWTEYYDYGNVYVDSYDASLSTTLAAESGYTYRISCKHYAKKSLLSVETISNISNTVDL